MGADQFLLPHLGAQARVLLDRIVASGADGVDRRDTHDWALSRLIELRYVEESPLNDTAFICTAAGRFRWQIEILADEQRDASTLRRYVIRHRLDERFNRLGIDTSTALTTVSSPVEPRLHRSVQTLSGAPPKTKMRSTSALAMLFAAGAAAAVVISGSTEPQDVQDWLFPPTRHAVAVLEDPPKANVEQAALVAAPVAATVTGPVDRHIEEAGQPVVVPADLTPAPVQRSAVASIDAIVPSSMQRDDDVADQPKQVPDSVPAKVEEPAREVAAVPDASSPHDGAILKAAVTAVSLIDSMASKTGRIAADLTAGVERGVSSIAAALLHTAAAMDPPAPAQEVVTQQASADVPAPVAPATEPPPEHAPPTRIQPPIVSSPPMARAAIVHATPDERTTARAAARMSDATVDPQQAVVEQLNLRSLAAARRGEAWRPNGPVDVAKAGRPL